LSSEILSALYANVDYFIRGLSIAIAIVIADTGHSMQGEIRGFVDSQDEMVLLNSGGVW
jgi:hypothetical protein